MTSPLTYLYLTCFVAMIIAATLVAVMTPPQLAKRSVVVALSLGGLWALADFFSCLATTPEQMRILHQVFTVVWALLPFFLLRAALAYAGYFRLLRSLPATTALLIPPAVCLALALTGRLHVGFVPLQANGWFFRVHASSWQQAVNIYFLLSLLAAGAILQRAGRRTSLPEYSRTSRLFLWGGAPTLVVGGLCNGGLSFARVETPFLGSLLGGVLGLFAASRILHRQFFSPLVECRRELDQTRDTLTRSEELLRSFPEGVAVVSPDRQVLQANALFDQLTGPREDGSVSATLLPRLPSPSSPRVQEQVTGQGEGRPPLLLTAIPVEYAGQAAVMILLRDLSSEKALEARLEQTERIKSIGTLAGGVAHDMNNILGTIMGLTSIMQLDPAIDEQQRADVDKILAACRRGRDLTHNLLGFARGGKYRRETFSLNQLVEEVEELLSRTIARKVSLEASLAPDLALIEGDPSQIAQALMNLCINALEAMSDQGTLCLTTENLDLGAGPADRSGDSATTPAPLAPGRYVRVRVEDNGPGMDEMTRRKCLEPLFTTKPQGTGLGLAMVHGTVTHHGGSLTVESVLGGGTEVVILLPALLASSKPPPDARPQSQPSSLTGPRTILLVDDEEPVRQSCQQMLECLGHRVIPVASGEEALAAYRTAGSQISLVILDLVMPGLDGSETFQRLRELAPDLRVLLASGYSQEEVANTLLQDGAVGFLQKPFECSTLEAQLHTLDGD